MGMGTVFLVLIFISLIISSFKKVNEIEANVKAKKAGAELLADCCQLGPTSYGVFSVSVVFNICGQSIFHQSGGTGGRRRSDKSRM